MEWITALKKAIDFMEKNLCNNISADDVAKEVCISSFYLQTDVWAIFSQLSTECLQGTFNTILHSLLLICSQ